MLAQQPFQLGDDVAAAAEVDPRGRPVLKEPEPDLVQAGPVGLEPLAVAGVDQDLAPEQAERPSVAASTAEAGSPERRAEDAAAARLTTLRASTRPASSSRV